jgi:hypothetical protein
LGLKLSRPFACVFGELKIATITRIQDGSDPPGCLSNKAIVPQPEYPTFSTPDPKRRNLPLGGLPRVNQFSPKSG